MNRTRFFGKLAKSAAAIPFVGVLSAQPQAEVEVGESLDPILADYGGGFRMMLNWGTAARPQWAPLGLGKIVPMPLTRSVLQLYTHVCTGPGGKAIWALNREGVVMEIFTVSKDLLR